MYSHTCLCLEGVLSEETRSGLVSDSFVPFMIFCEYFTLDFLLGEISDGVVLDIGDISVTLFLL